MSITIFEARKVRLVAISDSHGEEGRLAPLPAGDVLVHLGDVSNFGHLKEVESFAAWLASQPHREKVVIAGNNDDVLAGFLGKKKRRKAVGAIEAAGARYLEREAAVVAGLRVWASPACPNMRMKAFGMVDDDEARAEWARMPGDLDVLLTHAPPHGVLDLGREKWGERAAHGRQERFHWGCPELARRVDAVSPPLHLFGHVHDQGGGWEERELANGVVLFVNASFRFGGGPETAVVVDVERPASGRARATVVEISEVKLRTISDISESSRDEPPEKICPTDDRAPDPPVIQTR